MLGGNSYILYADNLDSDFLHLIHLKTSNTAFAFFDYDQKIQQIINGVPRIAYRSGLNFVVVIFSLFKDPLNAYIFNHFLIHAIGFWGMFLLLSKHIFSNKDELTVLIISLSFSLIPTYNVYGLSVMGQPLLLFAFWNIYNNKRSWWNWLIIILFPFYSFIVYVGPFIAFFIVLFLIWDYSKKSIINKKLIIALVLLILGYMISEFNMIISYILDIFVSHRKHYGLPTDTITHAITKSGQLFLGGYFHSGNVFWGLIFILSIVSIFKNKHQLEIGILVSLVGIALFHGFYSKIIQISHIHFLTEFALNRFHFLYPLFWFVLFALAIKHYKSNQIKVFLAFSQLCLMFVFNEEFKENFSKIIHKTSNQPSYDQLFAKKQFDTIRKIINQPQNLYRVVSVGIEPTVAQFNGFYTLDSYQANYPAAYHEQFGKAIEPELKKNAFLAKYYYQWGNRIYTFSDEVYRKTNYVRQNKIERRNALSEIENLSLNMDILKQMGGKYLFSGYPIKNAAHLKIELLRKVEDNNSWWDVYVYKIN